MGPLLYVLGASVLGATALAAAAALRRRSLTAFGLAAYLLAWGELVLLAEVLSTFRAANLAGFAIGQFAFLAVGLSAWYLRGRSRPPRLRLDVRGAVHRHPIVVALAVAVLAAALYAAFIGLATPPSNGDAMAYRLSRAAAWLQHGGIHWIPESHTERQNAFPWVSEIALLWTFALYGRDTVATLPQLAALAAVVAAVYGLRREARLLTGRVALCRPAHGHID